MKGKQCSVSKLSWNQTHSINSDGKLWTILLQHPRLRVLCHVQSDLLFVWETWMFPNWNYNHVIRSVSGELKFKESWLFVACALDFGLRSDLLGPLLNSHFDLWSTYVFNSIFYNVSDIMYKWNHSKSLCVSLVSKWVCIQNHSKLKHIVVCVEVSQVHGKQNIQCE